MSKHFEREIENLYSQLQSLFGNVEQMIDLATRAIYERKSDQIETVLDTDAMINDMEVAIEEDCLKILALHQPVAMNLRRLATIIKINVDLERMADLACNIAERARDLNEYPYFPVPERLPGMARRSAEMVRMAIDSFVGSDAHLAKKVIQCDESVDADNQFIINELKELMKSDSSLVEPALHCFSASRHIERLADHAENIAEDVVYFVDGDIVRHKHGQFSLFNDPDKR
ncbi:MAG: phosphate signaling complex protein PhoU [Pirellulaceae bacterium]